MENNFVSVWRPGMASIFHNADAQRVAEEIYSIGEGATPEQIYEKAKGKNTELHKCLEWDNRKAADKYRLQQCGNILRCLIIKKKDEPEKPQQPIRVFHYSDVTHTYVPTVKIVRNVDEYQALLEQAMRELRIFKAKYSTLSELKEILDLID